VEERCRRVILYATVKICLHGETKEIHKIFQSRIGRLLAAI
jgi:hypothetical protein